ncbi:hypothetical protein ACWD4T_52335, partial [Streptomyces umbrinus]
KQMASWKGMSSIEAKSNVGDDGSSGRRGRPQLGWAGGVGLCGASRESDYWKLCERNRGRGNQAPLPNR